jgi:putative transposase
MPPPHRTAHAHSDRGIEFSSLEFKTKLRQHGFVQSMNRASHINDNAYIESFFQSLKIEGLFKMTFDQDQKLWDEVISYIQFYNQHRLHSSIGYMPPAAFEHRHLTHAAVH